MKRHVTKEDRWVANKHMKGGSTSFAIKEIQSKNTMRYLCMPVRKLKTLKTPNASKGAEKLYLWHTAGRSAKWHSHSGSLPFLIKVNMKLTYGPAIALLGICPKEIKLVFTRNLNMNVYSSFSCDHS